MDMLTPKDHAEAVAIFRAGILGVLVRRELERGELRAALRELAEHRFRPPGSQITRSFSVPTLERWYYRHRKDGAEGLRPRPRSDCGRAQELTGEQRELLLDIRREHASASVPLILRTLVADGRLAASSVSAATIRRLFRQHGLDRRSQRGGAGHTTRLRWQAERPGALWHGDVCHGPALTIDGVSRPLRIHALLDDASRFIVVIEARHTEREVDMLALLVKALRRHGPPDALYLDNGSTYSGEILRVACARLGIALLHARPYDPQARGKMERFWRTLREGCLDHIGTLSSLHDVQVRLLAFLDQHYHRAPHASLMGRAPSTVWAASGIDQQPHDLTDDRLRDALTVRERRRVRRDTTVSVDGEDFELDQGFLAGRLVTVARAFLDEGAPWVEHEGKRYELRPVDPVRNATRKRPPRRDAGDAPAKHVPFDPAGALLDQAAGRTPKEKKP
jgi:transposase InsO family protein